MTAGTTAFGVLGALELAATLLSALAGAGACALALLARDTRLRTAFHAHRAWLDRELRYVRAPVSGKAVLRAQFAVLVLLTAVPVFTGTLAPLLALPVVIYLPAHLLARMRNARTTLIEAQLDRFLVATAHALRANPALAEALASAARLSPPLGDEIEVVLREHALGAPLDQALTAMAERVQSPVVSSAIATLRVARTTGGELSHTLENAARALREMARLEGVVRTKTAEGRAQTWVIAFAPAPLFGGLTVLDPSFLEPVWTTSMGHGLLACAGLMWAAAVLAARRITRVNL